MPRRGPPDHTGPDAVAGLAKRRAKLGAERIELRMRFDGVRMQQAGRNLQRAFRAIERERRRKLGEAARVLHGLPPVPGWIDADPPTFAFPGWGPRWRPFDWSID
jgi:hypothetical protein